MKSKPTSSQTRLFDMEKPDDLDAKVAPPAPTVGTKARATLLQLQRRWGFPKELENLKRAPELLQVRQADGTLEHWVRFDGAGAGALFELIQVSKEGAS